MKKLLLTLGAVVIATSAFAANYRKTGAPLTPEEVLALPADTKVIVRTHANGYFGWWKAVTTNEETGEGYFAHRDTLLPENQEIFPEDFVYSVTISNNKLRIRNANGRYLPKAETLINNTKFSSNVIDPAESELLSIINDPAIDNSSSCAGMYVFRASTVAQKNANSNITHSDLHFENQDSYCIPKYFQTANQGLQQPSDNNSKTVGASLFYLAEEILQSEFSGAKLVTRESYTTDLINGAVIALQCKDTNGGLNYFFNGPAAKSHTLSYEQLYQLEAVDGGFVMKRLSNNKYVGKINNSNNQNEVDAKTDAVVFTSLAPADLEGWTSKPTAITPATAPTIRFNASGTYLNCRDAAGTPLFATGKGGYSGWFVYTFSPEQVEQIHGQYEYSNNDINSVLLNKKIQISNIPATTLTPGWYALYNVNRKGYVKQESSNLKIQTAFSENGVGATEEIAPYLFYVSPNPYPYYDGNKISISSAYGSYFYLITANGYADIQMTALATELECELINGHSDIFYIKDLATGKIADGNSIGGAFGGYESTIPTNANGNNAYKFFPVTFRDASENVVNYTVNLTHDNRILSSTPYSHLHSTKVFLESPAFFDDYVTINVPRENNSVVNVALTELNLPFKYTETTDSMIWQAVQIHSSYKTTAISSDNAQINGKIRLTWTYTEADSNTIIESEPTDITTNGFADTQLWAFVGNMADGFKIYNKAAGTGMWLYEEGSTNNSYVKVGTTADGSVWKPYVSTSNSDQSTYCCLRTAPTNPYININVNLNNATSLTHWSGADQGSTCWFTAASEPMLETAAGYKFLSEGETYTGPRNAVGAILIDGNVDLSYGPAVIAAATADKYDLEKAEALRNLIAAYTSANVKVNELEPNGFYRIENILNNNQFLYTHETDGNIYSTVMNEDDYRTNYHSIFKFEPVPDHSDRYYLLSQGKYIGEAYDGHAPVQVEADATRGEYDLVRMDHDDENHSNVNTCAAFAIRDNLHNDPNAEAQGAVRNHFHQGGDAGSGNYRITSWGRVAHGSHFYIEKAEDIKVDLEHELNDMHIGFGYFPFPVRTIDENTQFYTIHESNDKTTGEPVLTYAKMENSIPAHTPVMIGNKNLTTVTLEIVSSEPANARRRVISAEDNNALVEGTQETDSWSSDSWTNAEADQVPEGIVALGVNVANVKYMTRTITLPDGGNLTVDFMYTRGNERLDICGVALLNNEGNIVASDFHTGYSGNNKENKEYAIKVSVGGTYSLRYYTSNTNMDTNGDIFIDFINKDKSTVLAGHLRAKQVAQGDFIIGTTTSRAAGSLGFVKLTQDAPVQGNYVTLPASNLYHPNLANVTELPLVDRASTTDIQEISNVKSTDAEVVYDLQGRRLSAPVKGFNIINGRKVFLK